MSLSVVAANSGYPTGGFSLPDLVSLCVVDDGSGGNVYINGLGITSVQTANAVDLKKFFTSAGMLFNSGPLLRAFKALAPPAVGSAGVMSQLVQNLDLNIVWINVNGAAAYPGEPLVGYLQGLGGSPANVPFLSIARPFTGEAGVPGVWRVDIRLRHSITN